MNNLANLLAANQPDQKTFRHAWNSPSKTPRHLTFNEGAEIQYMRDGILLLTDNNSGTYERVREFGGPDRQSHEVILKINARIFSDGQELTPEP